MLFRILMITLIFGISMTMSLYILFTCFLCYLDRMSLIRYHTYCCEVFRRSIVYLQLESLFIVIEGTFFISLWIDLTFVKLAHIHWRYSFVIFVLNQLRIVLHTFLAANASVGVMLQVLIHICMQEFICIQMSKTFSNTL